MITAVVNPVSGTGRAPAAWAAVAAHLPDADLRVEQSRSREHATATAEAAARAGRVVVAVGGDGMVRDVAAGVLAADGVLGIVPAGRGNDFALSHGWPADAAGRARLLRGEPRATDVIEVAGTVVPGNAYCGLDSVANQIINGTRRLPARLVYRLAPVRAILTWRAPMFTVTLDGTPRTLRGHMVVVGNSGSYGHGLRIVPSARTDDGLLHVLLVADIPRRAVARFMREAERGAHIARPECEVVTAREITIDADRPLPVCGDGELLGSTPTTMRIRPGALRLLRP